jgi:hypothetical protein
MCYLGLEYLPTFGMLLGLARSDRLIPWTSDNDYMISTSDHDGHAYLWDSASHLEHGLLLVYDGMDRMCVNPSFANGKLLRWKGKGTERYVTSGYPYTDFYVGDYDREPVCGKGSKCAHHVTRPYERKAFYNGTLHLNFPSKPQDILTVLYGSDWKVPDPKKYRTDTNCRETGT